MRTFIKVYISALVSKKCINCSASLISKAPQEGVHSQCKLNKKRRIFCFCMYVCVNVSVACTNTHCRDRGGGNTSSAMASVWISIIWRKTGQKQ
jgi:hypothetical protein